mmetsp:Transcript_26358/g.78764  ORF Transcript_26358/g.78764 Transcript_26358/m.78764 type:complete len:575 (+) Transcript_26358:271-1995(+)
MRPHGVWVLGLQQVVDLGASAAASGDSPGLPARPHGCAAERGTSGRGEQPRGRSEDRAAGDTSRQATRLQRAERRDAEQYRCCGIPRGCKIQGAAGEGAGGAGGAGGGKMGGRPDLPPGPPPPKPEEAATNLEAYDDIPVEASGEDCPNPVEQFAELQLHPQLMHNIEVARYMRPTPVQRHAIPVGIARRDLMACAQTGSGKTGAFLFPVLHQIMAALDAAPDMRPRGCAEPRCLILSPTRELATQIHKEALRFIQRSKVFSVVVYGGAEMKTQINALDRGCHVLVATPGRLVDLIERGKVRLTSIAHLVLDEADRMLDMGFEKDVRTIIGATPASRRTVMFTATWPEAVRALASEFLTDNVRVNIGSDVLSANHRVSQCVEVMEQQLKEKRLLELLKQHVPSSGSNKVLVFALYKKEAARVESMLRSAGLQCVCIQGDMSQAARTASLEQFKSGKVPLLVATDVAARGLDIPLVEVVINYTFPLTIEDYVHRIGRTGRGGRTGHAHTFFTSFDKAHAGALQNILREASQPVPDALTKFGSTVKKKEHKLYGAFGPKEGQPMKAATKIVFGDDD